jgi:anti-sigma factor RsiW
MMAGVRHLELAELLALRDGEGTAFARAHVESCAACRGELERLYRVRAELRALPTMSPPRELWPRVAAAVRQWRLRRRIAFGTSGTAVAAVLVALVVLRGPSAGGAQRSADVWVAEAASQDLGPVISRSRQLESLLEAYRPTYKVYDAPTALAVSVLEDRIVLLDRMLAESRAIGADRQVLRGLWGERVEALETLVGLELVYEGRVVQGERVWR